MKPTNKNISHFIVVNYRNVKISHLLITVLYILSINNSLGQTNGDYRSLKSGDWAVAGNWEIYNGTSWTTTSSYPGQNAGNYEVTILAGDTISVPNTGITTQTMGFVTISGTLILNGGQSSDVYFTLNTPQIHITPGLSPYASITFFKKCQLNLPTDAIVQVWTNGLQGDCNNNQDIIIGSSSYAVCHGAPGDIFTFDELMTGGGTINSVINPSVTNTCAGSTVSLAGSYLGAIENSPTYKWRSSGPQTLIFSPDSISQNNTITPTMNGSYLISLTVTTINEGIAYSNTEKFELTVYKKSADPTAVTPGKDTIMASKSTTLTLIGGGGGDNETIKWYTSSCGGTLIGSGNNITITPTVTTTYCGRYEDAIPCGHNTACAQTTIVVIPYANTWKGSVNTDFGNPGNWLDNTVPKSGENITFDNAPVNDCILDSSRTIGDLKNTSVKNFNISTHNLTINGEIKFSGSGKLDATTNTGSITYAGSFDQSVKVAYYTGNTIANLIINNENGVSLNGDLTITNTLELSNGSFSINTNTLTLTDSLKNNSGQLVGGGSSTLIIAGNGANITLPSITLKNLTLDRTNGLTLSGSVQINETLTLTNGTLSLGPNNLTLKGGSPTRTNGKIDATNSASNITFQNASQITLPNNLFCGPVNSITLNGGGGITLSENISINKNLFLNNGKIHTGSNILIFENTANEIVGANADSYIDGSCKKIGNTAFTFAIGNPISYAPIGISTANGAGDPSCSFIAHYYGTDPNPTYDSTKHESTIAQISEMEYWTLDRVGTNNVAVTLSWNTRSGGVSLLSDLVVIHWDGSQWTNLGNTSTSGDIFSGTVTSNPVSNFSPFTLGSLRGNTNLLPVIFSDFNVKCSDNHPLISWVTSSEQNNEHFEIEQSTDATNWKSIHQTAGAGNSTSEIRYTFTDRYSPNMNYYFRIKSMDFDNKYHYSQILYLESCVGGSTEFKASPNPSNGIVFLKFSGSIDKIIKVESFNLIGIKTFSHNGFTNFIDFSNQPDGIYYVVVDYDNSRITKKITISKQ